MLSLLSNSAKTSKGLTPVTTLPIQVSQARILAQQLRNTLKLGPVHPIGQLTDLLESALGVHLITLEQSDIAGACALIGDARVIFVSEFSDVETLYICARQIGHLIGLAARSERGIFAVIETVDSFCSLKSLYERFADHFALELLITDSALGIALKEVRKLLEVSNPSLGDIEMLYLARIFGVSFAMLARRCERAQLLPKGGASTFVQFLNENFVGPEHRANQLRLPPRVKINVSMVPRGVAIEMKNLVETERLSLEELASEFSCSIDWLEKILLQSRNLV